MRYKRGVSLDLENYKAILILLEVFKIELLGRPLRGKEKEL
jgi:hypothetical protein